MDDSKQQTHPHSSSLLIIILTIGQNSSPVHHLHHRIHLPPMSANTLSALLSCLPSPFSRGPTVVPGVTPLLFSTTKGLSDEPPLADSSAPTTQAAEGPSARQVQRFEEWMDRLERQWSRNWRTPIVENLQVQFIKGSNKKCHKCQSTEHLVAVCPICRQCQACGKTGHKTRKCPAHRRQEQEEWSITWDQQWNLQNTEDWSVTPGSPYPANRHCQACRGTGDYPFHQLNLWPDRSFTLHPP